MDTVNKIITDIISILKSFDTNDEFTFITEYPSSPRPSPIKRPTAVFGLSRFEIEDGGFGEYLGTDDSGQEMFGRRVKTTVSMRLYIPRSIEATASMTFFDMISSLLTVSNLGGQIIGMTLGSTKSDKSTDCFLSEGEIRIMSMYQVITSPSLTSSSFIVKGETQ